MEDSTNTQTAKQTNDIHAIQSQCGVSLEQAVELYTQAKHDVVQAISLFLAPSLMEKTKQSHPMSVSQTQHALNRLRVIANEKDKIFSAFLSQNKPPPQSSVTENQKTCEMEMTRIEDVTETPE